MTRAQSMGGGRGSLGSGRRSRGSSRGSAGSARSSRMAQAGGQVIQASGNGVDRMVLVSRTEGRAWPRPAKYKWPRKGKSLRGGTT